MKGLMQKAGVAAIALLGIACLDTTSPSSSLLSLSDALVTLPAGFTSTNNTFGSTNGNEGAFMPPLGDHGPGGGRGGPGEHGGPGMMGGGLGPDFAGGIGFGRGFDGGPFGHGADSGDCTFSTTTGKVTCTRTDRGLTVVSSSSYAKADGTVQSAPDSTTNAINRKIQVTGTVTRRDSAVSTVNNVSDRTVTGLAVGSTQRTVNGTSRGEESTTGTNSDGAFTASRLVGDTTSGLIIPVVSGKPTYPTAGSVIRSMKSTVTVQGQSPVTRARREVITYDGSATATIVITQDGTTKTCSLPLPRGIPTCQ
jgi:hypothetical protein